METIDNQLVVLGELGAEIDLLETQAEIKTQPLYRQQIASMVDEALCSDQKAASILNGMAADSSSIAKGILDLNGPRQFYFKEYLQAAGVMPDSETHQTISYLKNVYDHSAL